MNLPSNKKIFWIIAIFVAVIVVFTSIWYFNNKNSDSEPNELAAFPHKECPHYIMDINNEVDSITTTEKWFKQWLRDNYPNTKDNSIVKTLKNQTAFFVELKKSLPQKKMPGYKYYLIENNKLYGLLCSDLKNRQ